MPVLADGRGDAALLAGDEHTGLVGVVAAVAAIDIGTLDIPLIRTHAVQRFRRGLGRVRIEPLPSSIGRDQRDLVLLDQDRVDQVDNAIAAGNVGPYHMSLDGAPAAALRHQHEPSIGTAHEFQLISVARVEAG
jgi:hypothetical protein